MKNTEICKTLYYVGGNLNGLSMLVPTWNQVYMSETKMCVLL